MTDAAVSARQIASNLLDITGEAMMSGNFDAFADCFILPQELETPGGRRRLNTRDELRATFDAIRTLHQRQRVTHLVRHCVEAAFRDDVTIASTHESRTVTDDLVLTTRPYPAFSIIKRENGRWRIAFTRYEVQDAPDLMSALTKGAPKAD